MLTLICLELAHAERVEIDGMVEEIHVQDQKKNRPYYSDLASYSRAFLTSIDGAETHAAGPAEPASSGSIGDDVPPSKSTPGS